MIGLVLVTHGKLATEFVAAMEHVVGPQPNTVSVCIGPDDDMEQRRQEIIDGIQEVENGAGVVILTDMFGGTPSNISLSLLQPGKVDVLTGANLPMLLRILGMRTQELSQLAQEAKNAAIQGIVVAGEVLSRKITEA